MLAPSLDAAKALVTETYGEGHVVSIWNERDRHAPRGAPQGAE
jgi:hypothetical protein